MKKSTKISVLISLVLITLLAIGAVSAADDTAITDDADLAAVDDVQTVDDAPTTDEINTEPTDIIVTDTGDSSDLDDADTDVISDTGLKGDSDDGDKAVVSDASSPKNALKAEPLRAEPDGTFRDLYNIILTSQSGSTITLDRNYVYDANTDYNYRQGITIQKTITINGAGYTIDGKNTARIFYLDGGGYYNSYEVNLNNLNLINGYANGRSNYGAAIYSYNRVVLTVTDCNFTGNGGDNAYGGVIYVASGTSTILHSQLVNNTAYYGGAFYIAGGTFNMHGCAILNNSATNGDNGYTNGNGNFDLEENWWGENHGPGYTFLNQRGSYYTSFDYYILTETLTSPITVEVDMVLDSGNTPTYALDPRYAKITQDADTCNTTEGWVPEAFTIEFTTDSDAYINVTVDNQKLALKVFAGENKKNITVLRVEVEDVTLPDQPIAHVYSDIDGVYNLTLGTRVIPVTVTDGEGTYQFTDLHVGQYTVIVSRVDDPVYKTTFNTTDFEVKRYATELSIDTETPTTTYGTDVTITHELTPDGPTGFITYYVDGSETGTQLGVNENFVLSGLAAGTHTVVAKYGGDGSYDVSQSEPLTIVVNPATLEFNVTNVTVNYPNKGTVNVTSNVDGIYTVTVNNVDYQVTVGNGKGSFEVDQELPVGEYVISWNIPAGNHTAASGTGFYNVTAPAPEFDITGSAEINYGQTNTITHTITEGATGTITYTVNDVNKGTLGLDEDLVLEGLDAGHYVVVASYSGGGNYGPTSDTFEFDVLPIDVSVTVTSPEVVYPNKGTIVLTASAPGTYTVKVGDKTYTATVTTANESVEVPVTDIFEVGPYDISVTADLGDNYNTVDTGKIGTYTVTKPATSLVITVTDFTYGTDSSATITLKQGETALTGKTVNVTIDGTQQTVTIGADGTATVDLSSFGAGKHNIVAIFEGDDNYALAYNITEFNVNKATPTITVTTEAITYGQDATINIALDGVNSEKLNGVVKVTIDGKDYDVPVTNGAGTLTVSGLAANEEGYAITAAFAGNDNYNAITNTDAKQVVNKVKPTLVIGHVEITYGEDAEVTITLEGVNGEKLNGIVMAYVNGTDLRDVIVENGVGYLTATGLAVGEYNIQTRYNGNENYTATGVFGESAIVVRNAAINVTGQDLAVIYPGKGNITITTDVAGAYTIKVGDNTYDNVQLVAGENTFEVPDALEVGVYPVKVSAEIENYAPLVDEEIATYTVNQADVIIFISPNATEITYGDSVSMSAVVSPDAITDEDITYYVDGTAVTSATLADLPAGTHTVVAKFAGDKNYKAAESNAVTITVNKAKADVTVTAESVTYPNVATVVVNSNVPGTYTIRVGNKDYAVVVGDTGSGSTVIDQLTPGTYEIDVSANLDNNYEPVSQIPATTLTVVAQTGPFVVASTGFGYATLAEALANTNGDDDTITVIESGTYTGTQNTGLTIDQTVTIKADEGLEVIFDAEGNNNFITIAAGNNVRLYNITVVNGKADYGGAVYVTSGAGLAVMDSAFSDNLAVKSGGAIYGEDGSSIVILRGEFTGNVANGEDAFPSGGAIYTVGGLSVITSSTFKDNQAGNSAGAIYMGADNFFIYKSVFTGNKANGGSAGALWVNGWTGNVEDCTFTENEARDFGGAIEWRVKEGTLTDSTFTSNKAGQGGAIHWYGKDGKITGTNTFTSNEATQNGGAIFWEGASGTVEGATFTSNKAGEGSHGNAIYWLGNAGTVEGSTFDSNTGGAGAIIWLGAEGNIKDSYFANNGVNPAIFNIYKYADDLNIEANTFEISTATIKADKDAYTYMDTAVITGDFNWGVNDNPIGLKVDSTRGSEENDFIIENFVNGAFTYELKDLLTGEYTVGIVDFIESSKNNLFIIDATAADDFVVEKAEATINVDADKYVITYGETVELSSVVSPADATGAVTYYVDDEPVDSAILTGLTGGEHTVYAKYAGDDNYETAVSEPITITVNKAVPTVTVSSNKDEVEYGETAELSSVVIPADATGAVTYYVDGEAIEGSTLSDLAFGPHTVVAKFAGDNNYEAAESEPITVYGLPKKGTYTDLQYQIDKAISQAQEEGKPWGELSLEYDFEFDREYDLANNQDFINGVVVNDSIFIKGNGVEISGEEQARIFNLPTEADVQISSLILSEGNAGDGYGGAIYSKSEDLQLYDILFSDNYAQKGGAIYVDGDNGFVMGSFLRFKNNEAEEDGGAVYVASAFKAQGEFSSNSANYGGAIFVAEGGEISVDFGQFNMNEASSGSSIYLSEGSKVYDLSNCNFEENTDYQGATVVIEADDVEIRRSNFTHNGGRSGSVYWTGDNGKLTDCNFTENQVRGTGSVVSALGDNFIIDSCNFDSNVARNDGIIYLEGNDAELNKVTIQNNNAGKGAIVLNDATISIADSLFKDNIGEALNYNIYNQGTIESITGTTFETIKPTITMDDSFAFGEVIPVNGTFDWGVKSPEMTMSFTVNGVPMEATVIDGKFAMNIDTQPDVGAYTVVISTFTDAKGNTYVVDTVTKTFEVTKQTPVVEVNDTTAEWNTPVDIPVKVTDENGNPLTGSVIVTVDWRVDGVTQVVELDENGEGKATFRINQALGEMTITANYTGNDNYKSAKETATLTITGSSELSLEVTANEVTYGDETIITVTAEDGSGEKIGLTQANVTVDDGEVQLLPVGADGTINLGKLAAGEHKIVVSFVNEFYEEMASAETVAKVNPTGALIDATVANYAFDETGKLIITVTDLDGKVLNGTVAVEIDDEILSTDTEVEDGKATVDLTGYAIGEHSAHVVFDNPNYRNVDFVTHFNVTKKTPVVEVNDTTAEWNTAVDIPVKVTDENGSPVTGTVLVTVDWDVDAVTQIVELNENGEGIATFRINQALGEMKITANYTGNDNYESAKDTAKLTITESTELALEVTANEVTYGEDTILTVTATDGRGMPVSIVRANVTIDGETKEYDVADGKINVGKLAAGNHTIVVSYVDEVYDEMASAETVAKVNPAAADLTVTPGEAQVTIDVKDGDEPISGIATVIIDGDSENPITVNIDETGHAVVPIDAAPGTHAVEVIFNNDNYTEARQTVAVNVPKLTPVVSVTGTEVEYGTPATVKVKVTDEEGSPVTGTVIVVASWEVDGETQVVELDENGEGEATFTLVGLGQGNYADINATYVATDKYASAYNDTEKIKITPSSELNLEVSANEVTVGQDTILTVTATDGSGAEVDLDKVNVTIDGTTKEYPVENGQVNIGQLPVGTTEITVSYDDEFYEPAQGSVNATVNKLTANVDVVPGNGTVNITAKDNASGEPITGTATVVVDGGEPQNVTIGEDGTIEYPIEAAPGPHTVEVTFTNDDYEPVNKTVTVIVPKYEATLNITNTTAPVYGQDVTIAPTLAPANATGTITYYVDGATTGTQLPIGENFVVSGLTAGEHNITAKYSGDENYSEAESNVLTLNVEKAQLVFTVEDVIAYYPNAGTVNVVANNDGVYTINVNNNPYTVTVENGKGTVNDVELGLTVGEYDITWNIPDGDNYLGTEGSANYTVVPAAPEFSITGSPEINYGQNNTIVPKLTEGATGNITYTIEGTEFNVTKAVGENVVVEGLDAGDYTVTATYSGDDNYGTVKAYFDFKVLPIDVVVSVASDEVYYPNTGSINLTASAPGTYTVLVGNKTYTAVVTEANVPVVVEVEQLEVGKYEINVTAPASTNYNAVDTGAIGTYVVSKAKSIITVSYDNATGKATVTLEGAEDHVKLNETISFELDGSPFTGVKTTDGSYVSEELPLAPGKHSIFVVFVGNENYLGSYAQTAFEVAKFNTAVVTVSADPIKEGEDAIIKITVKDGDKGLSGVVTVTLDGTDYAVDVTDGEGTLTVKNLVATETPTTTYPIIAKFNGNDEYAEATGEGSINVTDYNDVIIVISGGDENAQATLIDSDLNPINGKVNVTVDGGEPKELDVVDGKVIIPVDEEGDHDITVEYLGDDTHKPATEEATVFVGKKLIPTTMLLTVSDITYTENEEVVVILKDENGMSISGKVSLKIGDLVKEVTVTDGQGQTTISGLDAGTKTVIGEFVSDGTYAGTVVSTTFTVKQMKTRIIANNMTTTAINVSDDGRIGKWLTITLVDAKGRALANKKIAFGFNAKVYNKTTDANGKASLQINLQKAGDYTFAISYLGDKNYEGTFEVVKITVNKQKASMTASGATYKASAKTKTLTATLKDVAGNPMPEKKVTFTVNGKTYSAMTDSKGVAKVNVSLTKAGSYSVEVKFAGTSTYEALTRKVTLKLT